MVFELSISGGIAFPLTSREFRLDTCDLGREDSDELERLASMVLGGPPPKENPHLRDGMSYEVRFRQHGTEHVITAVDGGIPCELLQLIKLIKRLASGGKR